MAIETKGIGIKHWGLFIFGIFLLLIGLVASFYEEWVYYQPYMEQGYYISKGYPYQGIGVVLVLIGVVFVALGFFYSPRKSETKEKERVSVPAPPEQF
jgi:hypothetical protein